MSVRDPGEGDRAPAFELPSAGGSVSLGDYRGRFVVLYFYPKDRTRGCTKEACDFRDRAEALSRAGAVVLGISPDPVRMHERFAAEHGLPFALLADVDHRAQRAYGVRKPKMLYGRAYEGVVRSTFLIDGDGVIRRAWRNVRVNGHADAVLAALGEVSGAA